MSVNFYGIDERREHERAPGQYAIVTVERPHLGIGSLNARAFFALLGIDGGRDLVGSAPLFQVRRALMVARARFDQRGGSVTRAAASGGGAGSAVFHIAGLTAEQLELYLTTLEKLCLVLGEAGATLLAWS